MLELIARISTFFSSIAHHAFKVQHNYFDSSTKLFLDLGEYLDT